MTWYVVGLWIPYPDKDLLRVAIYVVRANSKSKAIRIAMDCIDENNIEKIEVRGEWHDDSNVINTSVYVPHVNVELV